MVHNFVFRGENSVTKAGLELLAVEGFGVPERRGTARPIPGASGDLFVPDGGYATLTGTLKCYARHGIDNALLREWFSQRGRLILGTDPGHGYDARIVKSFAPERVHPGRDACRIDIEVEAQPWRYIEPEAGSIPIESSGDTVFNGYNADAAPLITILGSGDGTVDIGGAHIEISGMSTGIVIDCARRLISMPVGHEGATARAGFDAFPTLAPGSNAITWTGGVESVTVKPNWREL